MEREWVEFLTDLSLYSIGIPYFIGLIRFENLNSLQKLIALLIVTTLLGEVFGYLTAYHFNNNIPTFHLFTVLQFVVVLLIMKKELVPFFHKNVFNYLLIGFILFAILDAFWWNGINNFNNYARPLSSILLLCFALTFFYKTLKELRIKTLEREPLLWLSIGVLIYHAGSLFIFLFSNYVKTSEVALLTLWGIHAIFNIILNVSYSIALWVKPQN